MLPIPLSINEGQRRISYVSLCLVVANIWVYIQSSGRDDFGLIKLSWGFVPDHECLATLFTHMFLHENPAHLMFNLLFFLVPAMKLEDAIGPLRFLLLYLACGIAACAVHVLVAAELSLPMIGASGAISGIVGAFMVLYPTSKLRCWIFPLPIFLRLPAWLFLGFFFVKELVSGYLALTHGSDSPVAFWAHIGGFAFGAVSMMLFFGWKEGLTLESRLVPMWRAIAQLHSGFRFRMARPWAMALGWALQALVCAYAVSAYLKGGIVDENRPTDIQSLMETNAPRIAASQDVEELVRQAIELGSGDAEINGVPSEKFWEGLENRIAQAKIRHRNVLAGDATLLNSGWIGDIQRFHEEELPSFPQECQIKMDRAELYSILYRAGVEYEIVFGTHLNPRGSFKSAIARLHENRWVVEGAIYSNDRNTGRILSSNGKWALDIIVAPNREPEPAPIVIIWNLFLLKPETP